MATPNARITVNSAAAIFSGVCWLSYLVAQFGAVGLGLNSISGSLLRLFAVALYLGVAIAIYQFCREFSPISALIQLVINLVAVGFHARAVANLLELQPDVAGFEDAYDVGQILMSIATFAIAMCLIKHPALPSWVGYLFLGYSAYWFFRVMLIEFDLSPITPSMFGLVLTILVEVPTAFYLIWVGIRGGFAEQVTKFPA